MRAVRNTMGFGEWAALALGAALVGAALGVIGGYAPWISPDTPTYLAVPPLPEGWGYPRHPLYGWMTAPLGGRLAYLPPLQTLLFLGAALFLHHSLRAFGASARAAGSATAALLGSSFLVLWHNALHPEMPAVVSMLAALAFAVRAATRERFWTNAAAAALLLGLAYLLRPSLLPAIVLLPAFYAVLARMRRRERIGGRAAALLLLAALPFLANSAIRWRAVGDFNIVSFGGFQMSGMAGLMMTPDVVARLPEDIRPLGQAVLDARTAAERTGDVMATPLNSRGERSFVSAALGYYDIYARTYDDLLQSRIGALRDDESWVSFNGRLMRLSLATIRAAPGSYAAWLAGGTMRFVGRAVAGNPAFVLGSALFVLAYLAALWKRRLGDVGAASDADVPVLLCLALVTVASAGLLTVVTTFPAARYVDTAALLLPALPIYGAATLVSALLPPRPA